MVYFRGFSTACFLSGINRHFHMACIHDKFATSTGKKNISSKQIWDHLHDLYNLQALVSTETRLAAPRKIISKYGALFICSIFSKFSSTEIREQTEER